MTDNSVLFDRRALKLRRQRIRDIPRPLFLADLAADMTEERLALVLREFPIAVDLASPGSSMIDRLKRLRSVGYVLQATEEIVPPMSGSAALQLDAEYLPLGPASVNLIVSILGLTVVNDLPGTLIQAARALRPDGAFLAVLFGPRTLNELRSSFLAAEAESGDLNRHVAPFIDVREAGALLQRAGLALPVVDSETITVRYDSPFDLMAELRAMGMANPLADRDRRPLRRDCLQRMAEHYMAEFSDPDGRIRASFELVFMSAWSPHESQQKPLSPGSARVRMADALGSQELSAGETAAPKRDKD